ncbi:MAG: ABC transporter substrate-binding protein [Chloroflexota bacterium]|nr:ABC transporter substrate-binding protein [Chloroflexota bacterium]
MANRSFWDKYTGARVSRRRAMQMAAVGGASVGAIAVVGCSSSDNKSKTPAAGKTTTGTSTSTSASEGTPKAGGTLHGTVSLVLGKDPMKASTFLTHALASYSYSRLMRFKTTLGELSQDQWYVAEPEVASKVENPDPLTYIFTLRDDVKFHNVAPVNGRKLGAKDVVYSFNRYQSISPNKGNMAFVDSVTASADDKQVTFKLKEPFGLFLNRVASFQDLWIMPQEFIESSDTASEDRMLGSGPFIFDQFTPSVVMSWKKNPDYFEKDKNGNALPYLDGVNLAIITDQNQVLSQFAAGQLDAISVPPKLLDSVNSQNASAIIDAAPRNILSFLYFEPASNTEGKKPFNDERVRQGMSRAIDRDGLLGLISKQGGLWPDMPINAGFGKTWWLDPQGSDIGDAGIFYKYDVSEAKKLFSAAGVTSIDSPMHFSSTVYTTIVPYYDIVRQALPAMLNDAGVTVKDVPEEYGTYFANTFIAGKFDGFAFGLESVFSDIAAYWQNMFYPRDAGGGRNHSSVNDPTLVANIKKMLSASSADEIHKQNFELQKYTSQKMYYVPVVTPVEFAARVPKLKGVVNTTGPTTYAVGTESALTNWIST